MMRTTKEFTSADVFEDILLQSGGNTQLGIYYREIYFVILPMVFLNMKK
jgi:hypothetical protein